MVSAELSLCSNGFGIYGYSRSIFNTYMEIYRREGRGLFRKKSGGGFKKVIQKYSTEYQDFISRDHE